MIRMTKATLRSLLPGLSLAIAVHWAALDFWRGQGMLLPAQSVVTQLQVSVTEVAPPATTSVELRSPVAQVQPPEKVVPQQAAVPPAAHPADTPVQAIAAPVPASLPDAGFRDMNTGEALVFYRIALARRLDPLLWRETAPAKLVISLSADGAASAWRFEDGGAIPEAWASAIAAAEVPGALKGRVQDVVLEISP